MALFLINTAEQLIRGATRICFANQTHSTSQLIHLVVKKSDFTIVIDAN